MSDITPEQMAAELEQLGQSAVANVQSVTSRFTAELQAQVQRNASGRPGPNAPTGDYRRSINRRVSKLTHGARGEVGTSKPQARRLEMGFRGVDSLGRRYNQPPYPHFGPAVDEIEPAYLEAIAAIADPTAGPAARTRGLEGSA